MDGSQTMHEWLDAFASAVRDRDLQAGAELFGADAIGYGTRAEVVRTRAELIERQWAPVWASTVGFTFTAVDVLLEAPGQVVAGARWRSETPSGRVRTGRCTLVLTGTPLLCVHSHFSLTPVDGGQLDPVAEAGLGPS